MLSLLIDGAIAMLLLVALGFGLRLERRLRQLRCGDGAIRQLIEALDAATERSAAALDGLRRTAEATSQKLAGDLASVQRLLDDLQFLTARGEQLADRLEEQIQKGRPPAPRPAPPAPAVPVPAAARPAERTAELERALRTLR
jgi:hypothetical protein